MSARQPGHPTPALLDEAAASLETIKAAVVEAPEILEWPDNWDEEGSPGYSETTWTRARDFLLGHAQQIGQNRPLAVPAPRVLPGPDGSIDLHWSMPERELLVNVPADSNKPIGFYGDTAAHTIVKGNIPPTMGSQWLVTWLTE